MLIIKKQYRITIHRRGTSWSVLYLSTLLRCLIVSYIFQLNGSVQVIPILQAVQLFCIEYVIPSAAATTTEGRLPPSQTHPVNLREPNNKIIFHTISSTFQQFHKEVAPDLCRPQRCIPKDDPLSIAHQIIIIPCCLAAWGATSALYSTPWFML